MNGEWILIGLAVLGVVSFVLGAFWLAAYFERKKREALAAAAAELGLSFYPEKTYETATRFHFLDKLDAGANRYAQYVMRGVYEGYAVVVFEYHYETYSHSKNGRQTHHHYLSVFVAELGASFPEVVVAREGVLSKIAQAFGYDDIDFESHEFSRKYCVRSADKRFAYDVCNPQMIEFLLAHPHIEFEIEGSSLAVVFGGRISPDRIHPGVAQACGAASKLPRYLFERVGQHA
jgi:hypothetical protein